MIKDITKPEIIQGSISIDDRGSLSYCNDFNHEQRKIQRSYTVKNHSSFIRAFHGHKIESKYVEVIEGAALIVVYKVKDWETGEIEPGTEIKITLSSQKPGYFYIPPGYANGAKTLVDGTIIKYYSTVSLETAATDDFRFSHTIGNFWQEDYR